MVYKYNNAIERAVGEELTIKDLFAGKNMPIDLVISKLNGFHGSFINQKCTKHYFMLEGKAEIALICTPSYDPDYEQVIKTL